MENSFFANKNVKHAEFRKVMEFITEVAKRYQSPNIVAQESRDTAFLPKKVPNGKTFRESHI